MTTQLACARPTFCSTSDLPGIAVDDRVARLPADPDAVWIQIECDVLEAGLLEYARDILSDASESADHHVVAFRDRQAWPESRASQPESAAPIRPASRA